jgi:CBS-domain-containing membrane protein
MSAPLFAAIAAGCIGVSVAVQGLPDFVKACLGAAAAFSVLEAADTIIPYPIVAGPHAAVAAILFAGPAMSLEKKIMGVLGGHAVAMAVAIAHVKLLPEAAKWAAKTAIVAAAIGAQKAAGTVHPPACGIAFVWATSGQDDPMKAIGPIIGCAILIAVKELIDALSGSSAKAKAA